MDLLLDKFELKVLLQAKSPVNLALLLCQSDDLANASSASVDWASLKAVLSTAYRHCYPFGVPLIIVNIFSL